MAIISRWIGFSSGVMPQKAAIERVFSAVTLERGLLVGGLFCLLAIILAGVAFKGWELAGFGAIDVQSTMRLVIPSVTLLLTGGEIMVGAFLLSSIKLYRSGTFEQQS
jgi:hypothetical protein